MIERDHTPTPLQDLDFFANSDIKARALKAKARHERTNKKRNRNYWWSDFIESLLTPYRMISLIACMVVMFRLNLLPALIVGAIWGLVDFLVECSFSTLKKRNRKRRSALRSSYEVSKKRFDTFIVHHYRDDKHIEDTTETLSREEIARLYLTDSEDLEEHEADLLLHRAKHALGCPNIAREH